MQRNYLTGPHEGGELKDSPKGGLEADGKTKAGQDWAEVTVQSSWGQGGVLTWNCTKLKKGPYGKQTTEENHPNLPDKILA